MKLLVDVGAVEVNDNGEMKKLPGKGNMPIDMD